PDPKDTAHRERSVRRYRYLPNPRTLSADRYSASEHPPIDAGYEHSLSPRLIEHLSRFSHSGRGALPRDDAVARVTRPGATPPSAPSPPEPEPDEPARSDPSGSAAAARGDTTRARPWRW